VVVIPFNKEFSQIKADTFLNEIVVKLFKPSCVIVGYDHHFGFQREGSPKFLTQYGKEYGFDVDVVDPITDENVIISSTHIRGL
ncbi:uncharacterized protein METZ01_LOCUS326214, partial [marine metagenome]